MTDDRTCRCRGQFAMHKPHPHADRDGSEARAQLEREHERALAAYVPDDEPGEVARLRAILSRVEALAKYLDTLAPGDRHYAALIREATS